MIASSARTFATRAPGSPPRLLFIDALRGFDMFWITGGDVLCRALAAWLMGGLAALAGSAGAVVLALGGIAPRWIALITCDKNGTFLRV